MYLEYDLLGVGWAMISIGTPHGSAKLTASYLHDSLQELSKAALLLCKGNHFAEVTFVDEPGEHRFLFKKIEDDEFELVVHWYKDWPTERQNPDEIILCTRISPQELRKEVLDILWKIDQKYGPAKYREMWINHDFP